MATTTLYPEQQLQCIPKSQGELSGQGYFLLDVPTPHIGQKLIVTLDGVTYTPTLIDSNDVGMFPDTYLVINNAVSAEEVIQISQNGEMEYCLVFADGIAILVYGEHESCTIKIEKIGYNSEHYKYLLLKRLQRHFSLRTVEERDYTYTFFGKLFEGITVTEEAYNNFIELMDVELSYIAENNIYKCEDIPIDYINENQQPIISAFENLGITLVINTSNYSVTFTKPDGKVMVYKINASTLNNYFYINTKSGMEYNYAKQSMPYYCMENMEVIALEDDEINRCGKGCYWRYDADTATITISGDGVYYRATDEKVVGSGNYSTLVIGANVSRLASGSLSNSKNGSNISTIVLLHADDFPLIIDSSFGNMKNMTWDVYTDNEVFRNYTWHDTMDITWHSLNEWESDMGETVDNPTTMAMSNTWYRGTTAMDTITEINFVKDYTPTGNETESWAADVGRTGAITCYVDGTILTICSNGSEKIMANKDSSSMFYGNSNDDRFKSVVAINGLDMLDTSNVTNMRQMFYYCYNLTSLDLSNFNTSSVTTMASMFYNCSALTSLDLSNFNTSSVTTMASMFYNCSALTSLDLSNFNTSSVTKMNSMFYKCSLLLTLDLSSFDTSKVTSMNTMFRYCAVITVIYVGSGWTTVNATTNNMFDSCGVSEVTYI